MKKLNSCLLFVIALLTIHCSDEDEPETFLERFDKVYFVHQDETYSRSITQFNNDTFFYKSYTLKVNFDASGERSDCFEYSFAVREGEKETFVWADGTFDTRPTATKIEENSQNKFIFTYYLPETFFEDLPKHQVRVTFSYDETTGELRETAYYSVSDSELEGTLLVLDTDKNPDLFCDNP